MSLQAIEKTPSGNVVLKQKDRGLLGYLKRNYQIYLMLVPAFIYYLLFRYFPIYGLTLAFKELSFSQGLLGSPWVGLKYAEQVFQDRYFWISVQNTLILSLMKIFIAFPLPILLSLMLNEIHSDRFRKTTQTLIYLPRFLSWVIVFGLLINIFSVNGGLVANIFSALGLKPINFFIDGKSIRWFVTGTHIWKTAGWGTIIYFATITGINPELYESAVVDGAGRWAKMWHITLPEIKHVVAIMLILETGQIMTGNFEQIYVFLNPLVQDKIDILNTFEYRVGIREGRYSYAAAADLFRSVVQFAVIFISDRVIKLTGEEGIF